MFTTTSPLPEIMQHVSKVDSDFARSLTSQYEQRGSLSMKQVQCAVDMANREYNRGRTVDVSRVFAALEGAHIRLARFNIDGHEVRLKRNKTGTSYYALVNGDHVGSVLNTGEFRPGNAALWGRRPGDLNAAQVAEGMRAFGDDPIGTMVRYGIETGICGVCGRRLEDPASVEAGIGPVCAKRLGGL